MIKELTLMTAVSIAGLLPAQEASAHIFYFDIQAQGTQTVNPDGSTTYALISSLRGNGAWANATDGDWGNSHDIPWYQFTVANPGGARVDLSLAGGITQAGPLVTLADFRPAFTLYSGVLPISSHDGAIPLPDNYKDGGWQALTDTTLANDSGEVGTIHYLGHAGSVNSTAQTVSLSLYLAAGVYTVTPGGSCYECFPHSERLDPENPYYDPNYPNYADIIGDIQNDASKRRGYRLSLTVQPVPIPAAIWLFGSALTALSGLRRRHQMI